MGKGNRNRQLRAGDQTVNVKNEQKLSKLQQIRKQEKKEKITRIVTAVAILAIIVAIVLSLVIVNVNKNTKLTRTIAGTSEEYTISDAMVAYFMYYRYNYIVNYYSSYLSTIGLSTSTSLKAQSPNYYGAMYLGYDTSKTWYENFLTEAVNTLNEYVAFAEEATAHNVKLSDDELKTVDENINSLKQAAKQNGMSVNSYLSAMFTTGVKLDTVKKCITLEQLALKYYNQLTGSYEFSLEDAEKYREDHKTDFYIYHYISYPFDVSVDEDADDAAKETAKSEAKAKADELLDKATDLDAFKSLIIEMVKAEKATSADETADSENGEEQTNETETEEQSDSEIILDYSHTASYAEPEDSDEETFAKWAQSSDRAVGDKKVFVDSTGKATVYMISETLHYEKDITRSVRHILISATSSNTEEEIAAAEQKANEILAKVNEAKGKDNFDDTFTVLVTENSADTGSIETGGLYENVSMGVMAEEFDGWLFDESRVPGDTGVVKTDYGYHVMYYVGEGYESWRVTAEKGLKSDKFESDLESFKKAHPISWNESNLLLID